jgi:hypothetical protein
MDPNAAWEAAKNGSKEAAEGLVEWLDRGGFPPTGKTAAEVLLWIQLTYGEVEDG